MTALDDLLLSLDACPTAREWASKHPDLPSAWATCDRGDWLLWLAARMDVPRKLIVLAACDCARTALRFTTDPRALVAIETAERWCRGEATIEDVRRAASAAAYDHASDSYDYAGAYAADAASAAAASVDEATTYAVYAASSASSAADNSTHASASACALAHCADLVRARIPCPEVQP